MLPVLDLKQLVHIYFHIADFPVNDRLVVEAAKQSCRVIFRIHFVDEDANDCNNGILNPFVSIPPNYFILMDTQYHRRSFINGFIMENKGLNTINLYPINKRT